MIAYLRLTYSEDEHEQMALVQMVHHQSDLAHVHVMEHFVPKQNKTIQQYSSAESLLWH